MQVFHKKNKYQMKCLENSDHREAVEIRVLKALLNLYTGTSDLGPLRLLLPLVVFVLSFYPSTFYEKVNSVEKQKSQRTEAENTTQMQLIFFWINSDHFTYSDFTCFPFVFSPLIN